MAGLLNSTPQGAAPAQPPVASTPAPAGAAPQEITSADQAGAQSLDDPLLKQAEQGIEQSVPPEHRSMYESIVVAGMNVMFSPDTASLMEQQLALPGDLGANVADGVSKLIMIVFNESKQQADAFAPAAVLAAVTLMCQALDYAEQAHGAQVTPELLAQTTKATQMKVLKSFGVTEDQVNQVVAAGQQQDAGAPAAAGAQPPMEA